MFQDIKVEEYSKEILQKLPQGAFLVTKDKDGAKANAMTIGWGSIGIIWWKPVFIAMVRYSRYTYELLEKSKEFTVNIPLTTDLKKELSICGTKSGRDIDKFQECGFTVEKSRQVAAPIIKECDLFLECRVVYQQAMEPALLENEIKGKYYQDRNFHVLFYGEIVASYLRQK